MKLYESSTATLRAVLAHPSLRRDKIDETMDAMAEAAADARDVDDAIRIGGDDALRVEDVATEEELEAELKELAREVEGDEEETTAIEKLKRNDLNVPVGVLNTPGTRMAVRS